MLRFPQLARGAARWRAPKQRSAESAANRRRARGLVAGLRSLGAALLALEAGVHLQQYAVTFHAIPWLGPLFVLNAVGSLLAAVIAVICRGRPRAFAGIAGIAISLGALAGLALSYRTGGFLGWQETGLRTPVELAIASEIGAIASLGAALALGRDWRKASTTNSRRGKVASSTRRRLVSR